MNKDFFEVLTRGPTKVIKSLGEPKVTECAKVLVSEAIAAQSAKYP